MPTPTRVIVYEDKPIYFDLDDWPEELDGIEDDITILNGTLLGTKKKWQLKTTNTVVVQEI